MGQQTKPAKSDFCRPKYAASQLQLQLSGLLVVISARRTASVDLAEASSFAAVVMSSLVLLFLGKVVI